MEEIDLEIDYWERRHRINGKLFSKGYVRIDVGDGRIGIVSDPDTLREAAQNMMEYADKIENLE